MSQNVKVAIRCRPLTTKEINDNHSNIVQVDQTTGIVRIKMENTSKTFPFDCVFDESSSQNTVYSMAAREIVDGVLMGYNGTIFAYGQV